MIMVDEKLHLADNIFDEDKIEKVKPDGYILFDSKKGAISYMEIVGYRRWQEDGYENSFRYVQKLELDTRNW